VAKKWKKEDTSWVKHKPVRNYRSGRPNKVQIAGFWNVSSPETSWSYSQRETSQYWHYTGTWNCQGCCSSYLVTEILGTWLAWTTYVFHASLCTGVQAVTDDQEDIGRSELTIFWKTVSKWTYPYMKLRDWPTRDTKWWFMVHNLGGQQASTSSRRQDMKEEYIQQSNSEFSY